MSDGWGWPLGRQGQDLGLCESVPGDDAGAGAGVTHSGPPGARVSAHLTAQASGFCVAVCNQLQWSHRDWLCPRDRSGWGTDHLPEALTLPVLLVTRDG